MPHSVSDSPSETMAATVNGEKPTSAFLEHLISYPVISDSISTFKANPYGKKSIDLADHGYNTLAKPVLPYFTKPYQYVSPYISKADSLGDSTLTKVDQRFPIVKKPTGELYEGAAGLAYFPFQKGLEGKEYVFRTYSSECKKVGGEGYVTMGKAAFTTTLIVGSDAWVWLNQILSAKKEKTKEVVSEKVNN